MLNKLHKYQIGHFLDVHNTAYVFGTCPRKNCHLHLEKVTPFPQKPPSEKGSSPSQQKGGAHYGGTNFLKSPNLTKKKNFQKCSFLIDDDVNEIKLLIHHSIFGLI